MYIHIEELFRHRQYTDFPMAYCFDRKTYTICDSVYLDLPNEGFYERYIPLFQIDQDAIENNYIQQLNNREILRAFQQKDICFEAFIQQNALWDDWWQYYKETVYQIAEQWCEINAIKYKEKCKATAGKSIFEREPDVEVIFNFNGARKNPVWSGYRPAHLVTDTYLTTGMHCYYDTEMVAPDGTAKGTITFLTPEAYPHCLWIGKKIPIQEGAKIVGYATITAIYNPLLETSANATAP